MVDHSRQADPGPCGRSQKHAVRSCPESVEKGAEADAPRVDDGGRNSCPKLVDQLVAGAQHENTAALPRLPHRVRDVLELPRIGHGSTIVIVVAPEWTITITGAFGAIASARTGGRAAATLDEELAAAPDTALHGDPGLAYARSRLADGQPRLQPGEKQHRKPGREKRLRARSEQAGIAVK